MNRIPVVIDTDPGQDDALAIFLALAERERLDVLGLTTVAGNVPVDLTTANALRLVEAAGRDDVKVYRGADRPLHRALKTAEFICGPDGLEGANLPPPRGRAADKHAVQFLVDTLRAAEDRPVTLCPLGPLTNIALALAQAPELKPHIARIVLMGGARDLGNVTPAAEFNFYVDPHAARLVMESGVPIVLFGLHATHQAMATAERVAPIAALGSPAARAVTGMLSRHRPGAKEKFGVEGHPMHDPCVVAYLLWPELFAGRDCHVAVETDSELTMGRSVIDWWNSTKKPPNAHVIDRVDAEPLFRRIAQSLARLS